MMYYKTLSARLQRCGWILTDESHEEKLNEPGRIAPHYFKYMHPTITDDNYSIIEIITGNNKDGSPGKIRQIWQGGKPCRV